MCADACFTKQWQKVLSSPCFCLQVPKILLVEKICIQKKLCSCPLKYKFSTYPLTTLHFNRRKTVTYASNIYTVLHIFRQVLFGAGKQGNHQNFEKSLLTNKLWHVLMGMKQKLFFVCFSLGHFDFFFFKNIFFASSQWKSVNIYRIARIFRNFDDYPGFQPKTTPA